MLRVLSGPAVCGNTFRWQFKMNSIPAGKHAVVKSGPYNSNRGFGPILWTNILFDSEQDALKYIQRESKE